MELIPDTIDLSEYLDVPDFRANVRSAAEFSSLVKADLDPDVARAIGPGLKLKKLQGLLHFRPGDVTTWTGYNGHRKSMFTSQAVIDLAAQGERILIVSLEMAPWRTMSRMTRQACGKGNPDALLIDRFHDWTNGRIWLFDHVGRISPSNALALCRYFSDVYKGTQVVLDSWMMICASEENLDEQKQFSTDICRLAQETGLHIHVVTHCRKPPSGNEANVPSRYDIKGTGSISVQAANSVIVWTNKAKFSKLDINPNDMKALAEPCALLKCDKQRNGDWEGAVKLWFDQASLRFCDDRTSRVSVYPFLKDLIE